MSNHHRGKQRSNPVAVPIMHASASSRSSSPCSEGGRDSKENSFGRESISPPPSMISAAQSSRLDPTASTSSAIETSETPEPPGSETPTTVDLPPFARGPAQFGPLERPRTRNPQLSNLLSQSSSRQKIPPWELPPILSPLPTMPRPWEMEDASKADDMGSEAGSEKTISVPNSDAHLGLSDGEKTGFSRSQLKYLERHDFTPSQVTYALSRGDQASVHPVGHDDLGVKTVGEQSRSVDTRPHSVNNLTSARMTDTVHVRSPEPPSALKPQRLPSSHSAVPDAHDLKLKLNRDDGSHRARAQFHDLLQSFDAGDAEDLPEELFGPDDRCPSSPSERASAKRQHCPGSSSPPERRRPCKAPRRGKKE